jgi:hypothetical protein
MHNPVVDAAYIEKCAVCAMVRRGLRRTVRMTAAQSWWFRKLPNRPSPAGTLAEPQSIERRTAFFNQVAAVADLPADLRDAFEERAAIAEFDGGLDRAATERLAWAEVTGEGEP